MSTFPNTEKSIEKTMGGGGVLGGLLGVEMWTLSEMFDISSQSKIILRMKEKNGEIKS